MTADANNAHIRLAKVSKFYGDVMGVHGISADFEPGVTGLVGPNGAGKSTLMNLITGLVRPSRGDVSVLGRSPGDPVRFNRDIGYCAQYDAFPSGLSGREFVVGALRLHGYAPGQAAEQATVALERFGLDADGDRPIDQYSKGLRQALKLAGAICHGPRVLILDEPLNGLDPQARAEAVELFREFAQRGACVVISSHVLHEVDAIADRVVFLDGGYVVAATSVAEMRDGLGAVADEQPGNRVRVSVRCDRAAFVASKLFALDVVVEARLDDDGGGLLVGVRDADAFFLALGELVCADGVCIDGVAPAVVTVEAVYEDVIGRMLG